MPLDMTREWPEEHPLIEAFWLLISNQSTENKQLVLWCLVSSIQEIWTKWTIEILKNSSLNQDEIRKFLASLESDSIPLEKKDKTDDLVITIIQAQIHIIIQRF